MTPDDHPPRPTDPGAEPPLAPHDEQASALVDGLLDDAREADARRSPDVAARAAAMEAARTSLRDVPPADPSARDRAVAAALAAFDDEAAGAADQTHTTQSGPRPPVADIGAHRRRREATGRWVGAAAAAVLLVGVLIAGLVGSSSREDNSDNATTALGATEPAPGGESEATEESAEVAPDADAGGGSVAGDSSADAPSPQSSARLDVLGAFPTAEDLLDAAALARTAQDGAAGADDRAVTGDDLVARCPSGLPDAFTGAQDAVVVATGLVDGVTVEVWRTGTGEAARLVALDPSCAVLADRPAA